MNTSPPSPPSPPPLPPVTPAAVLRGMVGICVFLFWFVVDDSRGAMVGRGLLYATTSMVAMIGATFGAVMMMLFEVGCLFAGGKGRLLLAGRLLWMTVLAMHLGCIYFLR